MGLSQRKSVMIISNHWQEISDAIKIILERRVTLIHGEGGYTGKQEKILYSVIPFQELTRFDDLIRKIDPEAFVVISETMEAMGNRIGNQSHW